MIVIRTGSILKLMKLGFLCLIFLSFSLFSQTPPDLGVLEPSVPAEAPLFSDTGDAAVARRYLEWAEREFNAGRTAEALAALERGADYSAASSDISYYLAMLRSIQGYSRLSVLESCRLALETNRWERYAPEDAQLLLAKTLVELRRFEEALNILERCDPEKYKTHYCRILALRGFTQSYSGEADFLKALTLVMDRFPREAEPVRLLFDYAARREPNENLAQLIDLALRRLSFLAVADPELAYMAFPFVWNKEEGRTLVASYRALGNPNPASLPAALNCGLISGKQAVEELFAWCPGTVKFVSGTTQVTEKTQAVLDKDLILAISRALGTEEDRNYLCRNLLQFSGVITEDRDHDGIIEIWTRYQNGMICEFRYDADQDGVPELDITFAQGLPSLATVSLSPEGELAFLPDMAKKQVLLRWERYPAVLDAELEGKRYISRPLDYFYTPLRFAPLVLGGPDYPNLETIQPFITERSLVSFALVLEQPSTDFPGGMERIELSGGIPLKSTVSVNGNIVSETKFTNGLPVIQYLDMDMDGRMETIRRYDPNEAYKVLVTESDWDGDGIYEYAETLQEDGSYKKSWDFNRDGKRETER